MVTRSLLPLAAVVAMLIAFPSRADPLFESREFVEIRVTAPLRSLARDRSAEPEYRDATLAYTEPDRNVREFAVKLRPRGKSRRNRDYCTFPPLRVNFRKKEVDGSLFDGQDKLKLVTHCRTAARHEQHVYKEYLAYRMLNEVTDVSFRVRGLEIAYVDLDRDGRSESRFGFFIEDDERLARRLNLERVEPGRLSPAELEPEHASLMELFQFMIGNTDFSFLAAADDGGCCHNAVLMSGPGGTYLPVPYDFDVSGFVDPPYAVVADQLKISNVRQRLYRGLCRDGDVHRRAVERFRAARPAILATLDAETPLDGRAREDARRFVDDFFAILEDPGRLERQVLGSCRG